MRSLVRDRRGNAAVAFALSIPVLLLAAGAAVDYVVLAQRRTELQSIADAAALSAAKHLSTSYGQPSSSRQSAAVQAANAYTTVIAPTAQSTASVLLDQNTVQVILSETLHLAFGGFWGSDARAVSVLSKAQYSTPPTCILAVDKTATPGIGIQGSASIQASGCSVWSNATSGASSITVSGSGSITAGRVCAVGSGNGAVKPTLEKYCEPSPDPFAGRVLSAPNGCTYINKVVKDQETLLPGVYCGGLSINPDKKSNVSVTLSPGHYTILTGALSMSGNATLKGDGASILLGSGAYLDLRGNPTLSLSAMTTGPLAGLAIASDPSTPQQTSTIQGDPTLLLTANATGSIYLPNHKLEVGGSSDLLLKGIEDQIVVGSLSVSGSSKVVSSANFLTTAVLRLVR